MTASFVHISVPTVCVWILQIVSLAHGQLNPVFETTSHLSPSLKFVGCSRAPATAQDRRYNKNEVKISTFNVEFLFEKNLGTLDCPGKSCKWKSAKDAQDHIQAVASVIRDLDSDILVLNEVEDCDVLDHLIAATEDDSYRPYLIRGTDSFTAQQVGLLTRVDPMHDLQRSELTVSYPIPTTRCPATRSSDRQARQNETNKSKKHKGVSKHLSARFNITGLAAPMTLVGVHFLAQPQNVKRCPQREAQASVIATLIDDAAILGDSVIVLGDFNDFSATVPDIQNSMPISGVHEVLQNAGNGLANVVEKLPQSKRYSNWWDKHKRCQYRVPDDVSQLDHILLSHELVDEITRVEFGHKHFDMGCDSFVSDHFPLSVTIATTQGNDAMEVESVIHPELLH